MSNNYGNNHGSENKFISDEIWNTITDKFVLSIAPTISPCGNDNPYKGLNQKKSSIQLRMAPVGGTRHSFNLSLEQFDALKRAVEKAQENITMERSGMVAPFAWDLADACGDQMVRIFGDPDADGLCPMRKLTLQRQPLKMKNGQVMTDANGRPVFANYPWLIRIAKGRGKKITSPTGGTFPEKGSYKETSYAYGYLTDGQMKEMVYWEKFFVNVFNMSVKDTVLKGYNNIEAQKEYFRQNAISNSHH